MLPNMPTTFMLLCIVMVVKVSRSQQACDRGWFGEKCRFMCHCLRSPTCDMNGDCASGDRCAPGFFGPGCQYVDLALTSTNNTNKILTDENEHTCNNNKNATSVRLSWIKGVVFSWMRIYVSYSDNLHNVTVTLNNNVDCPNKKTFIVSSTAVDVTCDFLSKVFTLDVIGAMAANICSIYISGGRNVALRQPANQSSTYSASLISQASNAVDGDKNASFSHGHCTHTEEGAEKAEWSLFFSRPCTILEIIVYNRQALRHRLGNFTLLTYNEAGQLVYSYNEKRDPNVLSFDIQPQSRESIAIIKIRVTGRRTVGDRVLTLCEVETFGEVVCPDGYYGLSCQYQCTCQDTEECFVVTGACSAGCPIGSYGYNCSRHCDSDCRHLQCRQRSGLCLSCQPGYSGPRCTSMCELGTYGINCEQNCSKNCLTPCDINDGFCQCKQPYVGLTCSECPPSLYGENCTEKCSTTCDSELCHTQTGECFSCLGDMSGAFCTECLPGFYGTLCLELCSEFCYNDTCDGNTGECFPCTKDYTGPKCNYAPLSISLKHLLVAVGVTALISLFGACFFLPKTDDDEGSEGESDVTGTTIRSSST